MISFTSININHYMLDRKCKDNKMMQLFSRIIVILKKKANRKYKQNLFLPFTYAA